jgi:malonyl CoA-acyl carrier protein transacylase
MTESGAYIFPSQVVLDADLRRACLEARSMRLYLDLASDVLKVDVRAILRDGTDDEVNDPRFRRPLISLVGLAGFHEEQRRRELSISCVTGISLGFLSAVAAAGWLSLEDMVRMANVMAQTELDEFEGTDYRSVFFYNCDHETAFAALREAGLDSLLHLSVIVSSNQFLAACREPDLVAMRPALSQVGAIFKVVPFSYPGHCDLMGRVRDDFEQRWTFTDPVANLSVPVVNMNDSRPYTSAKSIWRLALEQYTTSMDWRGVLTYLEGLRLDRYIVLRPADFVLKSIAFDPTCALTAEIGGLGMAGVENP